MKRKVVSCVHLIGCTACGGESEFGVWVRGGSHGVALCETCAKVVATWHAKSVVAKRLRAASKRLRTNKRAA